MTARGARERGRPAVAATNHRRGGASAKPPARPSGRARSFFGRLVYWSLVLGLWLAIGGVATVAWIGAHLPPIQSLEIPKRPPSIQIVDVTRTRARRARRHGRRRHPAEGTAELRTSRPSSPSRIGASTTITASIPCGIGRAAVANILHRGVSQGGSTITQQLAKNLFLTQERTIHRKLQEALLALWLERKFSKTQILELYLNRVYFGSGAYGIEQASQRYFGKSAKQISLAEAALLAGLVRSPSRLAPTRNFDGAEKRAQIVLKAMAELNFVSPANERVALAHPPRIVAQAGSGSINYVADWVMDALNDVLGHVDEDIVVRTSIDGTLQASAEQALTDELAQKGGKAGVSQGALVAMTPDGAVRALIGGRSYAESQFNRAVAAKRQPGSAFKAFVYLTALEHGLTPDTVREDKPITIKGWQPENYKHEYYGPVTLTQALALSLNTVSVRLTMELGPAEVIRTAHRLGIASPLEPNASIALGTSEVSVLELVGAYATFANGGYADLAACDRAHQRHQRQVALRRDDRSLGRVVDDAYVAEMNAMMQQTLLIGTAKHAALAGLAGGGQDRHVPGFPRRLVHRLHRASRHRRLARQRRQYANQAHHWRQPAGGNLEPLYDAARIRACRSPTCPARRRRRSVLQPVRRRRSSAPVPPSTVGAAPACRRLQLPSAASAHQAAPVSTAGCSIICSAGARCLTTRARTARVAIHNTSVAHPTIATPLASGHALFPSR